MSPLQVVRSTTETDMVQLSIVTTRHCERFPAWSLCLKTFGASAPLKELQKKFGFEPDRVATAAKELLGRK